MKVLRFLFALLKFIIFGEEVTEEEAKARMSVCKGCPFIEDHNCGVCGCNLEKKTKWSSESCPKNKW